MELRDLLRPVDDADLKNLLTVSYSKISLFKQCNYQYKLKYMDKNFSEESTLAMEIGNIYHYVLQRKGEMLRDGESVDYELLKTYLYEGVDEVDEKTKNHIAGLQELKRKYWEDYDVVNEKSGMNYTQKEKLFLDKVLPNEMENDDWIPTYFEHPFKFVYDNGEHAVILHGFIDRIDTRVVDGVTQYRVCDYKSSQKVFRNEDLPTAMQFFIYALAVLFEFGTLPEEFIYRFILINETQKAMTKGWEKRGIKALDKLIATEKQCKVSGLYKPSPTPLCYWCQFHSDSPNADPKFMGMCKYHSMWTPTNKTFATKTQWSEEEARREIEENITPKPKRKLTF